MASTVSQAGSATPAYNGAGLSAYSGDAMKTQAVAVATLSGAERFKSLQPANAPLPPDLAPPPPGRWGRFVVIHNFDAIDQNGLFGFDLKLMPDVPAKSGIQPDGKSLIIVADVMGVLHFRIFDGNSKMVVDKDEDELEGRDEQISDLKTLLETAWKRKKPTTSQKGSIIDAVVSIVDHTSSFEGLRGISRVSFVQMLLEAARAYYLKWDAYRFAADSQTGTIREELQRGSSS